MKHCYAWAVGLLLGVSLPTIGQAQSLCPPAGIKTDPAAPANPVVPSKTNSFNWAPGPSQPNYPIHWRTNTLTNYIEAPYYQSNNATKEIAQLQGAPDIASSGWELIKKADGYVEGPNPVPDQVGVDNPYVILYNKLTGTLRVFWSVGRRSPPANFCQIELSFVGNNDNTRSKSGLLNRISGIGVALEDTPPGASNTLLALKSFPTADNAWFMADFPMDYDPCSCLQQSTLHFAVKLIQKANVVLDGESSGTLASIDNGSGSLSSSSGRTVFGGIVNGANTVLNGVTTSYNSGYDFRDKFKTTGSANASQTTSTFSSMASAMASSSFVKSALSAVPYVGAALSFLDYFVGGGSDGGPQAVSVQPMAINFSTHTTGSITTTYEHTGSTILTPGSAFRPNAPQLYPAYNEVLGVFNLLQNPNFSVINSGFDNAYPYQSYDENYDPYYGGPGGPITHTYLLNDLKYVLNPASGLRIKEMKVALATTGALTRQNYTQPFQQAVADVANGSLGDFTVVSKVYGSGPGVDVQTPWVDAGCLKSQYFTLKDAAYPRDTNPNGGPYSYYVTHYQTTAANVPPIVLYSGIYAKVMLTLERTTSCSTCQDVLLLTTFPIAQTTLTNAAPGSNPGTTDPYPQDDPSLYGPLPTCQGPLLLPASASEVSAFCQSNAAYAGATALRPGAGGALAPGATGVTHAHNSTLTQFECYPNPTAGRSTIRFALSAPEQPQITLVNTLGELVRTISTEAYAAGLHEVEFDTSDLAPGIYSCILQTAEKRDVLKIVVVK